MNWCEKATQLIEELLVFAEDKQLIEKVEEKESQTAGKLDKLEYEYDRPRKRSIRNGWLPRNPCTTPAPARLLTV